jgi:hypothetical protein
MHVSRVEHHAFSSIVVTPQIAKIENLLCCGDLRELWIQNNKITRITGLEHLCNLQVLGLAANRLFLCAKLKSEARAPFTNYHHDPTRIADFQDLQTLSSLPTLRDLSMSDPHFGTCPIAKAQGYRCMYQDGVPGRSVPVKSS